jgi:hypothetical protein
LNLKIMIDASRHFIKLQIVNGKIKISHCNCYQHIGLKIEKNRDINRIKIYTTRENIYYHIYHINDSAYMCLPVAHRRQPPREYHALVEFLAKK